MTSLPRTSTGSSSFHNTTFGGNRILPIMSAPQPPPQTSPPAMEYQDDHQPARSEGNHRRRPPEESTSLVQHHQQHGPMDIKEPPHLAHGGHNQSRRDGSSGDSGMGVDSPAESHGYMGQFMGQGAGAAAQHPLMPLDSSGGSGDSSGAEGKAAEVSSGGSGGSRLTRKSTAEDWFNAFNRDVRGNQSYDSM